MNAELLAYRLFCRGCIGFRFISTSQNHDLTVLSRINIDNKNTSLNVKGSIFLLQRQKKRHSRFLENTPKNFCEKLCPSAQISDFFSHINNLRRTILQIFRPFSVQFQTVFSRNSCFLRLPLCLHSSSGSLFPLLCRKH